ncbi:MAG: ATP-binding protein [Tannerella sp.]|jgi:AAA+ ATPase superfamily predicted ATPase|nr:ATP-binding protein [Tannerella sp.]
MEFTDRIEEQKRLLKALKGENPAFVVIYGRRRLGKSTLIKKVLTEKDVYYMSDQTERIYQIELLAKEIGAHIADFDKVVYPDWNALFTALNHRVQERITLCIDEFPYLVKSSPELPALLQKWIDSRTMRYNLVICGSSQQLMQGLILDGSAPLYGRADLMLKLSPIHIKYLQEILSCHAVNAIEEYAVWGGVPRYWELRLQNETLREAIAYHILTPFGTLYEEPVRLFMDDMRDVVQVSTLLSVIGGGVNRLSEIAGRLEKPATHLSGPLEKLRHLDFIEREIPFGEDAKNSKKSLYKVSEPFMDFYFRFVVSNRSLIELGRSQAVMANVLNQFSQYVSGRWEKLCRQAVSGQEIVGDTYRQAGRWWGSISREEIIELDVVAESMDGRKLLVGECKWTEREDAGRLLAELTAKAQKLPFLKGREIVPFLFLKRDPANGTGENIITPQQVIDLID